MRTKAFWRAALERAVRTMAQTAVSLIGVGALMSDVNWIHLMSASVVSGVVSVLTSIATGLPEVTESPEASEGTKEGDHADG